MLKGNATSVVLDQNSGLLLDPNSGQPPSNGPGSPTYAGNDQIVFAGIAGSRRLHEHQPGPELDPHGRRRRQPADRRHVTGEERQPGYARADSQRRRRTRSSWPFPPRPTIMWKASSTRAGSTRPSPPRPAASTACSSPRTSARTGPRSNWIACLRLPPTALQPGRPGPAWRRQRRPPIPVRDHRRFSRQR